MAFDNIKLEKGLYTTGKSFTDALEELDPSENYKGTSLEGLDAYERQLKRFNIKVSGPNSDTVSKFFNTVDSAALFPEYISRAVRVGMEYDNCIDDIVATTTEIDSLDYRSIATNFTNQELDLAGVEEGAQLPELTVKLSDSLTTLKKHGRMLVASYEAIKFQKLDLFTTVLKQIGNHITVSEFRQAIETAGENEKVKTIQATGGLTYDNLVKLWSALVPYHMTALVMNKDTFAKLLALPEFRDPAAGLDFHGTGSLITPFGAKVIVSPDAEDGTIFAVDRNYALEKVQAGGVITEFDKLIDRQLERASISTITGFSTIYSDAAVFMTV